MNCLVYVNLKWCYIRKKLFKYKIMKIAKLFFITILVIGFTSCNKDDDGNSDFSLTMENFSGTYKISSFNERILDVDIDNGIETNTTTTLVGDSFQGTYVFNSDGTYVMDAQYNITETVVVENNPPVVDNYTVSDDFTGTYTINTSDSSITITYVNGGFTETTTFMIENFSSTGVNLTYIDINDDPADGNTYDLRGEIGLVRQ